MGTLYIVATPIGNREDITVRALKILLSVDVVVAEDTRKTGLLLHHFKTTEPYLSMFRKIGKKNMSDTHDSMNRIIDTESPKQKLLSFYDEVEDQKSYGIVELLKSGTDCALVSDAGTPLVADSGYKLIQSCIKNGITIVPVPGSSAVITALVASGMPPDRFAFLGYFPQKKSKQEKLLKEIEKLKNEETIKTFIFYESPHRLLDSLSIIQRNLGDIDIVVAREMTKLHEEFFRGKISDAIVHFENPKGEFVILL